MLVSDFDYLLPEGLIAQQPVEPRHNSRLLILNREQQEISDRYFYDLPHFLNKGDLLVFNDTKVIPARLFGQKAGKGNGAQVEIFLLKEEGKLQWECLVKPGKRLKPGARINFNQNVVGEVVDYGAAGTRSIRFTGTENFREWLESNGETPLPPYITQKLTERERYQTIYAKNEGSVAAPTAGLHFSDYLLAGLAARGVEFGFLTLQVGLGTFRPVKAEVVEAHQMHSESFVLGADLVAQIKETKARGNRVIAVGTTVVRVLESQVNDSGELMPQCGETDIFIYPGFPFQVIDGMVTNFHLPKSTLLMLVSAFAGREFVLEAYRQAVAKEYRFFSFGDGMLVV